MHDFKRKEKDKIIRDRHPDGASTKPSTAATMNTDKAPKLRGMEPDKI